MKRIALAAAGAAVIGLTACSHTPTAAPASQGNAAVPVSCTEKYHTWEHGQGKGLLAALDAASAAETAGGTQVLKAALKKVRPAVATGARHPIPSCADPMGYWTVLLMHVKAGAARTGSASGMQAAMKDVPKIKRLLAAELARTTQ